MKELVEIKYWKDLYNILGREGFLKKREEDYHSRMRYFPEISKETEVGIDLGNGPVSLFEFSDKEIIAIDPLNDIYNEICDFKKGNVEYVTSSGEDLHIPSETIDWIFCVNTIDHTPDPDKMAKEINRVLVPGGRLYLEVNFDDYDSDAHYGKWNEEKVKEVFKDFKTTKQLTERIDQDYQYRYWAIYQKYEV